MPNTKSTTAPKGQPTPKATMAGKAPSKAQPAKAEAGSKPRDPRPNADRANETTHADGLAAVLTFDCEACGSKAGTYCLAKSGLGTHGMKGPSSPTT